ncbi:hypothetical protein C8J57DRAFT_1733991 [Mycena rebaudengoi]|nr:hypothetical protein C8J57DRAFT_1733991 [Mycena rebaudengoi]
MCQKKVVRFDLSATTINNSLPFPPSSSVLRPSQTHFNGPCPTAPWLETCSSLRRPPLSLTHTSTEWTASSRLPSRNSAPRLPPPLPCEYSGHAAGCCCSCVPHPSLVQYSDARNPWHAVAPADVLDVCLACSSVLRLLLVFFFLPWV